MKTYAFVFARGGSKGIHRKNLLELNGISLVEHSIKLALEVKSIDKVFVSTEDSEIASISIKSGAELINRPNQLANDNSPEWLCWQHAVNHVIDNYGEFQRFISLPPTAPLRSLNDVEKCLSNLNSKNDIVISITPSKRNPFFNIVRMGKNNIVELVNQGQKKISRRQDTPETFDIATVAYVTRPEFILKSNQIWDGVVSGVKIPYERAIDIDEQIDFEIATFLAAKKTTSR
tara:strand:+ start:9468 stop:10163 length:696 start_codon:yes stop_codon:yes gene_type:complete